MSSPLARPSLAAGVRYALVLHRCGPANLQKPLAFCDTGALARSLHRRRGEAGLQLVDAELRVRGREEPQAGVSVWALDPSTGDRRRFLGWAYLGGAGRKALESALRAEEA